jgi:hypothetical protein
MGGATVVECQNAFDGDGDDVDLEDWEKFAKTLGEDAGNQ